MEIESAFRRNKKKIHFLNCEKLLAGLKVEKFFSDWVTTSHTSLGFVHTDLLTTAETFTWLLLIFLVIQQQKLVIVYKLHTACI